MGFQMQICPILRVFWSILVKCCVHLPTSSSKTQMLPLEKTIFQKYWLFCQRFFVFTFDLCGLLSVIRKQQLKQCNYSVNQSAIWPDSGQILHHQYGISVAESQTFLLAKRPQRQRTRRNGLFLQPNEIYGGMKTSHFDSKSFCYELKQWHFAKSLITS